MSGYKLASVAGMAAAAVTTVMQYVQEQPGTQPGTTTRSTQPGSTTPAQPGYSQPGTTQPGTTTRPGSIPGTTTTQPGTGRDLTGIGGHERLFMLQNPGSEQRVTELSRRLQQIEQQMQESDQRLERQLSQARTLQGDRKVDALADVVQSMMQEHTTIGQYLRDLRVALTGNVSESGTEPGMRRYPSNDPMNPTMPRSPNTPGQPGGTPTTPRTPTSPTTPGTTPDTPGNPGGTPSVPR